MQTLTQTSLQTTCCVVLALLAPGLAAQGGPAGQMKQLPNQFAFNQFAGKDTSKIYKPLFVSDRERSRINFAYEFQPGWFATSFEGQASDSFAVLKGVRTLGVEWEVTVGFRIGSFDGLVENSTNFGIERDVWENNDPKRGELLDFAYAGMTYSGGNLRAFANMNGTSVGNVVTLNGTSEGYLRLRQEANCLEIHAWAPGGQEMLVYMVSAPQPQVSNYSFGAARMGAGTHILCLGANAEGDVNGTVETPAIETVAAISMDITTLFDELCGKNPDVLRIRGDCFDLALEIEQLEEQLPGRRTPGVQRTTQGNTAKRQLQLARRKLEEVYTLLGFTEPDIESAKEKLQGAMADLDLAKGALKGLKVKKAEHRIALQNNGF